MKNDMFLTFHKARSRYLSSYKDEIHPFCSLHRLAYAIGMTYNELPDVFVELTEQKVREIQKSVKDGTYTLSPLLLRAFARKGDQKPGFFHTFPAKDESNLYLGINPTLEDSLVLTALGRMLNLHFLRVNLFTDKSFGLRTTPNAFYSTVCARGKVLRLYKCDLTISLRTINRESLLLNLSHIVKDGAIIEFVDKFLSVPILDQSGRDFTAEMGCSIPTVGLLTHVLLNFALTEFDKEFQRAFPGVDYSRYIHEVFLSCPKTHLILVQVSKERPWKARQCNCRWKARQCNCRSSTNNKYSAYWTNSIWLVKSFLLDRETHLCLVMAV
ncbi:unnamed protein product [Ilex paraguariensis]|uniref:Uncharacterized protein n=1 Tax=Ilex paraguariensis TaxID=185542 RepID=A0ABC8T998_9AQUA